MSCIQKILNFNNEIRLHHWGTQSYAAHKALGKLYEGIDPLLDAFAETYIGVYGKQEIKDLDDLKLNGPFKISIGSVLDSFEDYLKNELPKEIKSDQTALLNIRDEMLALIQQTKYLLTLS
jgi:DNA-binding ferritin-like protein